MAHQYVLHLSNLVGKPAIPAPLEVSSLFNNFSTIMWVVGLKENKSSLIMLSLFNLEKVKSIKFSVSVVVDRELDFNEVKCVLKRSPICSGLFISSLES